jgi:hypothetical protein
MIFFFYSVLKLSLFQIPHFETIKPNKHLSELHESQNNDCGGGNYEI